MANKNIVKYAAYIDKESGNMVCTQLNCNYSIQVYDMAQNMSAIFINTSPNPQSQIEFYANNSTNPVSTTYSNCNLGINENNFFLYNMNGGTIWNTDLLANISTFYMPINVASTFTADNVSISGQLNLNDMILADPSNGFQLYGNDTQGYPTINFYSGSPGTGVLQYSMGVYNDIFYVIPNGGNQALQVYSDMSVNMPYSVSMCSDGTLTCEGAATINNTLTANTIVPTGANIGSLGSSTLNYSEAYINTINATGIQLNVTGGNPQGLSIIGTPTSDDATQIFFQQNASGTITNHWQLGPNFTTANPPDFWLYNNIGNYNVFQIHANTQLIDIYDSVNVTGNVNISETLTAATINATTINTNNNITTYTGSESGNIYVSEPFTGTGYKKVVIMVTNYSGSNTITFSTAFTSIAMYTSVTYTFSSSGTNPTPAYNTTLTTANIGSDSEISAGSFIIEGW